MRTHANNVEEPFSPYKFCSRGQYEYLTAFVGKSFHRWDLQKRPYVASSWNSESCPEGVVLIGGSTTDQSRFQLT